MAFTNFYIDQQTGASNLNAGSTSANAGGSSAAAFTYAGGTFVRATGVYTVASGNPLSDGVTVGTYASVYTTAGAVAATFVAQITARDATTITVDITTLKWGVATSVSEGAGATTLKVSGAWTSEVVLAATGLGTFTVPTSTKINMQGNLTVTASRTVSIAGATTTPIWFSGYATVPGDLDADTTNSLTKPVWTVNATFVITGSGNYQLWSGVSMVGNRTGAVFILSGTSQQTVRIRVENTSSNAGCIALSVTGTGPTLAYSWCKTPTTATTTGTISCAPGASGTNCIGVVAEGGGIAGFNFGSLNLRAFFCVALNNTGSGFLGTTGVATILNSTVSNATGDGVKWSSTPPAGSLVCGNLFAICGGFGINNGVGTNTGNVFRACNDFYACTSGNENGFGDSPSWFQQTDGSSPVTSSTDMTPVSGSNARNNGFPGKFENQSFLSYLDVGAVDHVDPAAGGGLLRHPGMKGGLHA